MKKVIIILYGLCLLSTASIRTMLVNTTRQASRAVQPIRSLRYPATKIPRQNERTQNLIARLNIKTEDKKPETRQLYGNSNWSLHTLLAGLGLGWLWQSAEDKEKQAEQEKNTILQRCRTGFCIPLHECNQFIAQYGDGVIAQQLFKEMIEDKSILFKMMSEVNTSEKIPPLVIPLMKHHYYTLACTNIGSEILDVLIKSDEVSKKELTNFAIRDMEKLCENAQSDRFFKHILVNNPAAVDGFAKKAQGHVEQLIATEAGKKLIDDNLLKDNALLAMERAKILVDTSKKFDMKAFNACMKLIKDDPSIETAIYATYQDGELFSLLKKIIYQKHCEHCTKDDVNNGSPSLKSLINNIDILAQSELWNSYIIPDKGLSHMVIDALQKEDIYKDSHYIFYHGQPSKLGFQQRLFSWFATKSDDKIVPFIYQLPRTEQEEITDYKKMSERKGRMYGRAGERFYTLYAVADLFSNVTLRYAARGMAAVDMPSITTEQTCKNAHQEKVYALFKDEIEALEQDYNKLHKKGQLLQFRVKKDKLEQFVFSSGDGGYDLKLKDGSKIFDLRTMLDIYRKNPEKIEKTDFAFGITIGSPLIDPTSGIECSIINSVDPKEWANYQKKEKALRHKINSYVKAEQKIETFRPHPAEIYQ